MRSLNYKIINLMNFSEKTNTIYFINGRYLHQRITGVQRYAREVIHCFGGNKVSILSPEIDILKRGPFWEQVILPSYFKNHSILWSPTNTGPLAISRQVVTIHDLSTIDHPEWFSKPFALWYRFLLPHLAKRVHRVITDSQFSKNRILACFQIPEKKVKVIYPGVGEKFRPSTDIEINRVRSKYKLASIYILAVGSLEPRKNLLRLLDAYERMRGQYPKMELVIVGSSGYPFKDPHLDSLPKGTHLLSEIPDTDLPSIYSGAQFFVYPSIYEGFGLPILEAMACGTPVIASNATSIPEVVGEAGMLFDPFNVDAIATGMEKVINDPDLQNHLTELGLQRAKLFTWDRTAQQVWELLVQALEETQYD